MGLPDKALKKVGVYVYNEDLNRWVRLSLDITSTGEIVTTSYNRSDFYTGTITIASAGTAQQGPSVQIPAGFAVVIKGRDGNTGNIFFARSQVDAQTSGSRITVAQGAAAKLYITNLNLVWFDAVTSNDIVELFVER